MTDVAIGSLPFTDALEALRSKLRVPTTGWTDMLGEPHGQAFTVAGATSAALLADLHEALIRVRETGDPSTFARDFDAAVKAHGWAYRGDRAQRIRTILDTNLRSSAMAGRWRQVQANKARRPYLQYLTVGDGNVRPAHAEWHGRVFAVDDPVWDTIYPPNGYRCRCTVRTLSDRDLRRLGLAVSPTLDLPRTERINVGTGEVLGNVPRGIDPGFDHHIGKAWLGPPIALGEHLARLPAKLREVVDADLDRWADVHAPLVDRWIGTAADASQIRAVGYLPHGLSDGRNPMITISGDIAVAIDRPAGLVTTLRAGDYRAEDGEIVLPDAGLRLAPDGPGGGWQVTAG